MRRAIRAACLLPAACNAAWNVRQSPMPCVQFLQRHEAAMEKFSREIVAISTPAVDAVVCKPALPFEDRCAHVVRVRKKHNNTWHSNMQHVACKHATCNHATCNHANMPPSTIHHARFNMQHDTCRSRMVSPARPRPQALARVCASPRKLPLGLGGTRLRLPIGEGLSGSGCSRSGLSIGT